MCGFGAPVLTGALFSLFLVSIWHLLSVCRAFTREAVFSVAKRRHVLAMDLSPWIQSTCKNHQSRSDDRSRPSGTCCRIATENRIAFTFHSQPVNSVQSCDMRCTTFLAALKTRLKSPIPAIVLKEKTNRQSKKTFACSIFEMSM